MCHIVFLTARGVSDESALIVNLNDLNDLNDPQPIHAIPDLSDMHVRMCHIPKRFLPTHAPGAD